MIYIMVERLLIKDIEFIINIRIIQIGMYVLVLDAIIHHRRILRRVKWYVELLHRWISNGM